MHTPPNTHDYTHMQVLRLFTASDPQMNVGKKNSETPHVTACVCVCVWFQSREGVFQRQIIAHHQTIFRYVCMYYFSDIWLFCHVKHVQTNWTQISFFGKFRLMIDVISIRFLQMRVSQDVLVAHIRLESVFKVSPTMMHDDNIKSQSERSASGQLSRIILLLAETNCLPALWGSPLYRQRLCHYQSDPCR